MGRLYLRKVVLDIVGQGGTTTIEDLRVGFKIEKTNESTPNTCTLDIYNLSDATRSLLEGKNTKIEIKAGYEETLETVFVGDITKVEQERDNVDIITKAELADGDNAYRNSGFSRGYPPGATLKKVLKDLADEMKVDAGVQQNIPDRTYKSLSLAGLIKDLLNKMTKPNKLEWSIQNETLQIVPEGESLANVSVILSPNTGLIGFPTRTDKGVQFESLLQPQLKPGVLVTLESRVVSGSFKVRKVTHEGDNQRGTFTTKCEATA